MKFSTTSRKAFIIRQYIIYGSLFFAILILALYHFNKVILQPEGVNPYISFLSQFSLDLSIILIPTVLGLANIRKNFRKNFNNLFSLKEKILHLREEVAKYFIPSDGIKERESFVLSPVIINEIKSHLRDFQLSYYADVFDDIIMNRQLFNLDQLLIEVIKITRQYDNDEYFENNWESQQVLKELHEIFKTTILTPSQEELLKEKFNKNVFWPIVYEFFFDNPNKYQEIVFYYQVK